MSTEGSEIRRESTGLPYLCLTVSSGLLVAWSVPRVKPVLWFGLIFGLLLGLLAVLLIRWFPAVRVLRLWLLTALLSLAGTIATLGITATRHVPAVPVSTQDAAAEALMRTLTELPADPQALPSNPGQVTPPGPLTIWQRSETYVSRRYAQWPAVSGWGWLGLEATLATLGASVVLLLMRRRSPETKPMEPLL